MILKLEENNMKTAQTVQANTAEGEARIRPHQAVTLFPPQKLYTLVAQAAHVSVHPNLPLQTLWTYDAISPGPTFVSRYGQPILLRNFNQFPPASQNGDFGLPSETQPHHSGHTPSWSDDFACDFM